MSLRLLLLEPPFYRLYSPGYGLCKAPLGLGSLAAVVQAETDAVVRMVHADFHPAPDPFDARYLTGEGFERFQAALRDPSDPAWAEVRVAVEDFGPDLVGISAKTPAWSSALACARMAREAAPQALILAGGPHPSAVGRAVLDHPDIDAAVIGEGEATLVDLVRSLSRSPARPRANALDGIPGLLTRAGRFTPRPPIRDLDALPFPHPAARLATAGATDWPVQAFASVFTARGCPHACAYCASGTVWGRKPRARSIASVLAEVAALRTLGVRHVHFDDDTFGLTHDRLLALCAALEAQRQDLTFSCETHVNLVTPDTARAMGRAGFATVQIGLESGDDDMLRRIGKGFGRERALRACACIKAEGLRLETFFMAGFPDETRESLAATRALMERTGADKIIYSIFTPYPGTPLHERCREMGLIGPGYDYSRHNHQSPENRFCPGLGPRFRELAAEMEAFVSRHNAARRHNGPPRP